MSEFELFPHQERLRHALQWLCETQKFSLKGVEEAAQRFDLSPLDEEFLLTQFVAPRVELSRGPD